MHEKARNGDGAQMTLKDLVLKCGEFDEDAGSIAFWNHHDQSLADRHTFEQGANWENARLRPLIELLREAVEMLHSLNVQAIVNGQPGQVRVTSKINALLAKIETACEVRE